MVSPSAAPFLIGLEHKSRNLIGWKTVPQTLSRLVRDNAIFKTVNIGLIKSDLILSLHTPGNVLTDQGDVPGDILQVLLGLCDQPQRLVVTDISNTWGTL